MGLVPGPMDGSLVLAAAGSTTINASYICIFFKAPEPEGSWVVFQETEIEENHQRDSP